MKAPINRIIEFSNVDGPGNRMAIFFQKCPFRCLYCHNPETINFCINCQKCVAKCPVNALESIDGKVVWHKDKCVNCDTCIKTCEHMASPKISYMSVEEVMDKIIFEKDFIQGITVSGGECMENAEFLTALFKEVKKLNKTCFTDSNGYYDFEKYPELLKYMDYCMLDVKAFDNDRHKKLCGQDNHMVIKNLKYLQDIHKLYEVRTVCIPGYDGQNRKTIEEVSKLIGDKCIYKIIKYRPFGVREKNIPLLSENELETEIALEYVRFAQSLGATKACLI